jgi:hypothetical protein
MNRRAHFLLRAAAVAVLAVEALLPRGSISSVPHAPAIIAAPAAESAKIAAVRSLLGAGDVLATTALPPSAALATR